MRRFRIVGLVLSSVSLFVSVFMAGSSMASATQAVGTATVTPLTGIVNGTHLSVSGSGWTPNASMAITECLRGSTSSAQCDINLSHITLFTVSSDGTFSQSFRATTGAVGPGHCGTLSTLNSCDVSIGYATLSSTVGVAVNISFAAPATTTTVAPKKHTITCTKMHKPSKRVTAVHPVCPAGYKIKK